MSCSVGRGGGNKKMKGAKGAIFVLNQDVFSKS